MSQHILAALLGGILMVGGATAFAEERQMSDQEVLKAWGVQLEGEDDRSTSLAIELKPGLTPLTDDTLEGITGAGVFGGSELPLGQLSLPLQPLQPPIHKIPTHPVMPPTEAPMPTLPAATTQFEMPVNPDLLRHSGFSNIADYFHNLPR